MITVVTISNDEQFYKLEPFDYGRSRSISDRPEKDSASPLPVWAKKLPENQLQELIEIYEAASLATLRENLEANGFLRAPK